MKRILAMLLAFVICIVSLVSCKAGGGAADIDTNENEILTDIEMLGDSETVPDNKCEVCSYEAIIDVKAEVFTEGVMKYICNTCGHSYSEVIPATRSLKILTVGSSFAINAMWHLYGIMKDGGVDNVTLGILYRSGCSLDEHYAQMIEDESYSLGDMAYDEHYHYYKNTTGEWKITKKTTVETAVLDEDWDIIVVQQGTSGHGLRSTFGNLDNVVSWLKDKATNPDVKFMWHMMWAFQQNTANGHFAKYGNNQQRMYESIVSSTKFVEEKDYISAILPSATAIQNLRTSYLGDTLCAPDGYHLHEKEGRYTAGLAWYGVLTGKDVNSIDWLPKEYPEMAANLDAMREAAAAAVTTPYSVTESSFKASSSSDEVEAESKTVIAVDSNATDAEVFSSVGLDISNFDTFDWDPELNTFYSSTSKKYPEKTTKEEANPSVSARFASSKRVFTREDIPVGSVIIIDHKTIMRPDGWMGKDTLTPADKRPDEIITKDSRVLLTINESWWETYVYRVINTNTYSGEDVTIEYCNNIRVYIPKN